MSDLLKEHIGSILAGLGFLGASAVFGYYIGKRASSTTQDNPPKLFRNADDPVMNYLMKFAFNEPLSLKQLREETISNCKQSVMLVDPIAARLVQILLQTIQAKRCIEIGVFTGFNSCSMALALPDDGEVIACDIEEENINKGRPIWDKEAAKKIKVKIGPAIKTLDNLIDEEQSGSFDLIFIDADKQGYDSYYERGLKLIRRGGFIVVDNTIWSGKVAKDENLHDEKTKSIHALNMKMQKDDRIDFVNLSIGDGLALCRKR